MPACREERDRSSRVRRSGDGRAEGVVHRFESFGLSIDRIDRVTYNIPNVRDTWTNGGASLPFMATRCSFQDRRHALRLSPPSPLILSRTRSLHARICRLSRYLPLREFNYRERPRHKPLARLCRSFDATVPPSYYTRGDSNDPADDVIASLQQPAIELWSRKETKSQRDEIKL